MRLSYRFCLSRRQAASSAWKRTLGCSAYVRGRSGHCSRIGKLWHAFLRHFAVDFDRLRRKRPFSDCLFVLDRQGRVPGLSAHLIGPTRDKSRARLVEGRAEDSSLRIERTGLWDVLHRLKGEPRTPIPKTR